MANVNTFLEGTLIMRKTLLSAAIAALSLVLVAPMATADMTPAPVPTPTVSPSPAPVAPAPAVLTPAQAIYVTPGYHHVNDRYWFTECEMYSSTTVRCRTSIFASTVFKKSGVWHTQNNWVFNNLTYLPSPEANWAGNNLGKNADWVAEDGRRWRTRCNTPETGRGACRNYVVATVASLKNGKVEQGSMWLLNSMVNFATPTRPWVQSIPAAVPTPAGVPSPSTPKPVYVPKPVVVPPTQSNFRLDSRCLTGRAFCVSKSQNKMAWVVNGKVDTVLDVRFGGELTPTRNGAWSIGWKSRNHVSSLYGSAMPYAMFFSGGQAIHYSSDFATRGYNGSSKGCVNVRDKAAIARLFDIARVGDKVIVYN